MTERVCPVCGRRPEADELFCPSCGNRLPPISGEATPGPGGRPGRALLWRLVALLTVVAVGVVAVVVVAGRDDPRPAVPTRGPTSAEPTGAATGPGSAPCAVPERQPDFGQPHLAPGDPYEPPADPASSGLHDVFPLPPEPRVYTEPVRQERAVHNLEHGYVVLWHAADPDPAVVAALSAIAEREPEVILSPYPGELPDGVAVAFVAWRWVQTCPDDAGHEEATALAEAFVATYRNGPDAPEASVP